MKEIYIPLVSTIIGVLITYILTKKSKEADLKKTELETVEIAVRIWREMAQEFEEKLQEMQEKYRDLLQEVKQLRQENKKLKANQQ